MRVPAAVVGGREPSIVAPAITIARTGSGSASGKVRGPKVATLVLPTTATTGRITPTSVTVESNAPSGFGVWSSGGTDYGITVPDENPPQALGMLGQAVWLESLAWDNGVALPSAATFPVGLKFDRNDNPVVLDRTTDKFYTLSGGSWNAGVAVPAAATDPNGFAFDPSWNPVVLDATTDKFYTLSGGSWNAGVAVPAAALNPSGLDFDKSQNVVVLDSSTDKFYTLSGGSWNAGVAVPAAATDPNGFAFDPSWNPVVLDATTDKFYTLSGGSWNAGVAVPDNIPTGLGFTSTGCVGIVGIQRRRVYTSTVKAGVINRTSVFIPWGPGSLISESDTTDYSAHSLHFTNSQKINLRYQHDTTNGTTLTVWGDNDTLPPGAKVEIHLAGAF